jgi:Flp pilus assembly protein TadG
MRFLKSESGTSLIEFAIVLPMLVLLVIGIIDVGRWASYGIVAANAARAGAQYGSQDLAHAANGTGIANAVAADSPNVTWTVHSNYLCSVSGGTPTQCVASGSSAPQNTIYYVQVQVSATFNPMIHYPGFSAIPISGSSTMRLVNQ